MATKKKKKGKKSKAKKGKKALFPLALLEYNAVKLGRALKKQNSDYYVAKD